MTSEELQAKTSQLKREVFFLRIMVVCFLVPKTITFWREINEEISKGDYHSLYILLGMVLFLITFVVLLRVRARRRSKA